MITRTFKKYHARALETVVEEDGNAHVATLAEVDYFAPNDKMGYARREFKRQQALDLPRNTIIAIKLVGLESYRMDDDTFLQYAEKIETTFERED